MKKPRSKKCKYCESKQTIKWGKYKRTVISKGRRKKMISVQRYMCKNCERTFSYLSRGLKPRCRYDRSARIDMIESKYFYQGGLRRVGGKPWESVRYSHSSIWNEIQEAGPKSRRMLKSLEIPSSGIIALDEDFLKCDGGILVWMVCVVVLKDNKHGIIVQEDFFFVKGDPGDKRRWRKILRRKQAEETRKFFEKISGRLDSDELLMIITDDDTIYPKLVKEYFPGAKHLICIYHILRNINRAFEADYSKKIPRNVKPLYDRLMSLGKAKDMDGVIKIIDSVWEHRSLFKPKGSVIRRLRSLRKRSEDVFRYLEEGVPGTNNVMEQVFARIDPLFEVMKSFQSEDGARNFLSNLAMFHNACPL